MQTTNDRFRLLRKACGKSQEDFGKALGLSKSGVSDIENGRRNVTEQHVIMLKNWAEFPVNEEWIRTGKGGDENMFLKPTPMGAAFNHFGYIMGNASAQKKAVLSALVEMMYRFPDDEWNYIFEQFEGCLKDAHKKKDSGLGES